MSVETQTKSPESQDQYFNEDEARLLKEKIPHEERISIDQAQEHFRKEGKDSWEGTREGSKALFSQEDLNKYRGGAYYMNSKICFVDRQGKAWITIDTPSHRKALKSAGYDVNPDIHVPFSNGEELSDHDTTKKRDVLTGKTEIESLSAKFKRMMDETRSEREGVLQSGS